MHVDSNLSCCPPRIGVSALVGRRRIIMEWFTEVRYSRTEVTLIPERQAATLEWYEERLA